MAAEMRCVVNKKERKLVAKIDALRLKFLRLLRRLGNPQIHHDAVFERVLHRLGLLETYVLLGRLKPIEQENNFFETLIRKFHQVEHEESSTKEDFSLSCSILVIGKTGAGKSSTINSIFNGEEGIIKASTNPFIPATRSVHEISGIVEGVHLRIFDTPGLKTSLTDQGANIRTLKSIKKHIKGCPPDIVLYVDRIDTQTLDFNDLPMMRTISSILGSSIWFNTIVALTHAASDPPDGPDGSPLDYELYVAHRSHVVQQSIRRATAYNDHMNPLALVENHPCCKMNNFGERVLPNGLNWMSQLLLQCYSSMILSDANSSFSLREKLNRCQFREFLSAHICSPLPFVLPYLMQSRGHLKALTHKLEIERDMLCEPDIDLHGYSVSELQGEDDFDKLSPFKPLRKSSIAKLSIDDKKKYFDEYDYRVKLLQKRTWMDRLRMINGIPLRARYSSSSGFLLHHTLPTFDSCPTCRLYFCPLSQSVIDRLRETRWDHCSSQDNIAIEQRFDVATLLPVTIVANIVKNKQMLKIDKFETSMVCVGKDLNDSTKLIIFKIQSIEEELAYTFLGEIKWRNLKKRNSAAGISVTCLGKSIVSGLKLEEQVLLQNNSTSLVGCIGITTCALTREIAYGTKLEVRFKDKVYPMGPALSTFGLSVCKRQGDLTLETNMQSQLSFGRNLKSTVQVTLSNLNRGSITIKTSTSSSVIGIIPVLFRLLYLIYSKI